MDRLQYSILDPTGNITALVESSVPVPRQPSVAAELMERHPEVEQVGFVGITPFHGDPVQLSLRMAGGEFCGNASMCAAALFLLSLKQETVGADLPVTVRLQVSGSARPVEVRLQKETPKSFLAGVHMPPAEAVTETELALGDMHGSLPVVRMEGISHIIIEPGSPFFGLKQDRTSAEQAVRDWCIALSADGLGLMFLDGDGPVRQLTPLVYIPGSGTVFWENSCASGTSAAVRYLAEKAGAPVDLTLVEPGGSLRAASDPAGGETWLYGTTRLVMQYGCPTKAE